MNDIKTIKERLNILVNYLEDYDIDLCPYINIPLFEHSATEIPVCDEEYCLNHSDGGARCFANWILGEVIELSYIEPQRKDGRGTKKLLENIQRSGWNACLEKILGE